jgi:SagB-type dehydrogenase family enzyme
MRSEACMAEDEILQLPAQRLTGPMSLEETLACRHSVRAFADRRMPEEALGQLLWAAQGISRSGQRRTVPSAGALYPLEVYAATPDYLAHYRPKGHALRVLRREDVRAVLAHAAWDQRFVEQAPVVVVLTCVPHRIEVKYGRLRGARYLAMEAGHAAQNVLLQAEALGMAGVPVGAFDDSRVDAALGLAPEEKALYILPIGIAA